MQLQIFKPGSHSAELTPEVLARSAAVYDPQVHEAPLVVGHPKHDAPAHGWVGALNFDESSQTLIAEPTQVAENFTEAVKAGRFKKISASFYLPNAAVNPVPGAYYLRHVGFLGAQPPAVKGLAAVNFAEGETADDFISVEFSEAGDSQVRPWVFGYVQDVRYADFAGAKIGQIASLLRGLREWIIDKHDIESADQMLPSHRIDSIAEEQERLFYVQDVRYAGFAGAKTGEAQKDSQNFGENTSKPISTSQELDMTEKEKLAEKLDFAERESALAKREAATDEREKALSATAEKASLKSSEEFAEKLVSEGKILPRDQEAMAQLLHVLPDSASVNFAEGDAEAASAGKASDFVRDFLNRLPAQVDYAERSAGGIAPTGATSVSVPREFVVDHSQDEQHQAIVNYAEKHKVCYTDAITGLGDSLNNMTQSIGGNA